MARRYDTKPARLLKRTSNHGRADLGDALELEQLGRSYLARPINPIICMEHEDGTLEVLDGNRRVAAILPIDPDAELPICITDEPITDAAKLEIQDESDAHTKRLTDAERYDIANAWLALNPGATAKAYAERVHRDESAVSMILSLDRCIEDVKDAARRGLIGYSKWGEIAKLPPWQQPDMLADVLNGATRKALRDKGRKLRRGEDSPSATETANAVAFPLGSGFSFAVRGPGLSLDAAIEQAEKALAWMKAARDDGHDAKTIKAWLKNKQPAVNPPTPKKPRRAG